MGIEFVKVIVIELNYLVVLNKILIDYFVFFKSWLLVKIVIGNVLLVIDELWILGGEYFCVFFGFKEVVNYEKFVYYLMMSYFG